MGVSDKKAYIARMEADILGIDNFIEHLRRVADNLEERQNDGNLVIEGCYGIESPFFGYCRILLKEKKYNEKGNTRQET